MEMSKKLETYGKVILLLLAVLVMMAGCSTLKEIKLGEADNGRQIALKKGQTMAITLKSNPSTGYSWRVAENKGNVLLKMGEPEFKKQSDLIGAPGVLTIHFKAINVGQTTLNLIYHRPWEKEMNPTEAFSLHIIVH